MAEHLNSDFFRTDCFFSSKLYISKYLNSSLLKKKKPYPENLQGYLLCIANFVKRDTVKNCKSPE